eukprot:3555031-Rhodomonas_salina.2
MPKESGSAASGRTRSLLQGPIFLLLWCVVRIPVMTHSQHALRPCLSGASRVESQASRSRGRGFEG